MSEVQKADGVVIIPTYNEKENIENIIRAVMELPHVFDVLIIDDGSPDGTAAIVKRLQADEFAGHLHLIERKGKLGLGTAYITGFKWSVEQNTTMYSKWMPIFRTTPKTYYAFTMPVPIKEPMSLSGLGIFRE